MIKCAIPVVVGVLLYSQFDLLAHQRILFAVAFCCAYVGYNHVIRNEGYSFIICRFCPEAASSPCGRAGLECSGKTWLFCPGEVFPARDVGQKLLDLSSFFNAQGVNACLGHGSKTRRVGKQCETGRPDNPGGPYTPWLCA